MATRFYLPSTGAAAVSPAFDLGWGLSVDADRIAMVRTKANSAFNSKAVAESSAIVTDVLMRQYVSEPVAAQTITGTLKCIARANENSSTADFRSQLLVRVVSGDGLVVRGTLIALDTGALASEWNLVSFVNRKFPKAYATGGASVTSVTAQDGDRLVVEIGYRAHNTTAASRTGTLDFGDPSATGDLVEDETGTTQLCPWVEFSQNLTFGTGGASPRYHLRTNRAVQRASNW